MRHFTVNANDEGQRLDKFVQKTVWGMPLSLVYKFIRLKKIKVNGKKSEFSYRLKVGDEVDMYIPDDFERPHVSSEEYLAGKPDIRIVYEDDNLLICDKPVGMLVHPGDDGENNAEFLSEKGTLIFQIKSYLAQKNEYNPEVENSFSPSLCNRIDRNTGGLVIAAKTSIALRFMNEEIKRGGVSKKYLCAVHGKLKDDHKVLKAFLVKDAKTKKVKVSENPAVGSKSIITEYSVLSYNHKLDLSLVEILLHTGRTHQIRAHMAFIGHPLLGDGKYAENKSDRAMGWKHQALYSYCLLFTPLTDHFKYLDQKRICADKQNIEFLRFFNFDEANKAITN